MNGVPQMPLSSMRGNKPGRPPVPERPITKIGSTIQAAFLDEILKISAGMLSPTPIADLVAKMWAPKSVMKTVYPANNPSKKSGFVMQSEIKRPSILKRQV